MATPDWTGLASWRGWRLGPVELLEEVDSTNSEALRRLDERRAAAGLVLVARRQSAGHGSRGRSWHDAPGKSLAMTVLLEWPADVPIAVAAWLGVVAITDLLDELGDLGARTRIKWPNDALVRGRKVAGVLAETVRRGDAPIRVALGLGLNVGHGTDDFPAELAETATSLALEGAALDVPTAAMRLAAAVDRRCTELSVRSGDSIRAAYLQRLALLDRRVRARLPERDVDGPLLGLELDGTLQVGDERLSGGHVSALREL